MDRELFLAACRTALELAGSRPVRERWDQESSCAGMSVGGLAHHLLGQLGHTVDRLRESPPSDPPIAVADHYRRAAWVSAGPDDRANAEIRDRGNDAAAAGPDAVLAAAEQALADLPALLGAPRDPDVCHVPWQGWSLTTDDWLLTRSMELVVHSDDLAVGVGLETPDFPEPVVTAVLGLLGTVAARRHGQAALVRALARPQRAPAEVSAF